LKTIVFLALILGLILVVPVFAQVTNVQNYVIVNIQDFNVQTGPNYTLEKGQSANITCNLVNTDSYSGTVSAGVSVPSSISYSVTSAGGQGELYFAANQTQPFTLTLTNTGNLAIDSGLITLTLMVVNTQPVVTDQKTFQVNFLAGLTETTSSAAPTNTPNQQNNANNLTTLVLIMAAVIIGLLAVIAVLLAKKKKP